MLSHWWQRGPNNLRVVGCWVELLGGACIALTSVELGGGWAAGWVCTAVATGTMLRPLVFH
jgi:hypothetical protein